jgi:hypothetical protein
LIGFGRKTSLAFQGLRTVRSADVYNRTEFLAFDSMSLAPVRADLPRSYAVATLAAEETVPRRPV